MGKFVNVKLEKIYCSEVDGDPGSNLEIRGILGARSQVIDGPVREEETLWHKPDNEGQNVGEGGAIIINTEVELRIRDGERLLVGGHIKEDDEVLNPDDDHGDRWRPIYLHDIDFTPKFFNVQFTEINGQNPPQEVWADFWVNQINP
ncbi:MULTISPECIES: hypothetical protein [Bacillus cereus group]|uniref:hypothetical protein n=1 Tax=Bacillus cereus group TaxID=86661 RepID=UPI0020CE7448|nr:MULTISPECIES: hypothetical protein [Bacillus cereus group]MCP9278239.1 hypothetical protein [Bacillus wiedmannii]MEB4816840.1 hypothetical protein [Bacillus thuringiensis]